MARELIILPRFKRDYRIARKHPEFDEETLKYVFDVMISGGKLPDALREHRLDKRSVNRVGFTECHLGADLLLIYRVRRESVTLHRIGTHKSLFALTCLNPTTYNDEELRYLVLSPRYVTDSLANIRTSGGVVGVARFLPGSYTERPKRFEPAQVEYWAIGVLSLLQS